MSPWLPALTARDVVRALWKAGFTIICVKGSHHHLRHPGKPAARVIVPAHPGGLPLGTVRAIVRQARLTEAEFLDLLKTFGFDVQRQPFYGVLDRIRLTVNTIKHGGGKSRADLFRYRKDIVSDPVTIYTSLITSDSDEVEISESHIEEFSQAVIEFWETFPERLTIILQD